MVVLLRLSYARVQFPPFYLWRFYRIFPLSFRFPGERNEHVRSRKLPVSTMDSYHRRSQPNTNRFFARVGVETGALDKCVTTWNLFIFVSGPTCRRYLVSAPKTLLDPPRTMLFQQRKWMLYGASSGSGLGLVLPLLGVQTIWSCFGEGVH